ncbi:DUF6053 domain-containing protein [Lysobacter enzymogenes]
MFSVGGPSGPMLLSQIATI